MTSELILSRDVGGDSFQSLPFQSPSSVQDVLLTITNDCAILLNNSGELRTILICCNRDHEQCSNLALKATNLLSCCLDIHIIRKCCKQLLKCCPASSSAWGRNSTTQPQALAFFFLSGWCDCAVSSHYKMKLPNVHFQTPKHGCFPMTTSHLLPTPPFLQCL